MINLLPSELNNSVVYARRNRTLLRWIIALAMGAAGIIVVILAGMFYINYQVDAYQKQVDSLTTQLQNQQLEQTQDRVEEISSSVKLASDVLSQEIQFSKLLKGVGGVIPSGTALQNLNITNDLDGGIDLQFGAQNYQSATQVQVNLTDPDNGIFEEADIQNISCSNDEDNTVNQEYKCQVSIRALFDKDSPFTFKEGQRNE